MPKEIVKLNVLNLFRHVERAKKIVRHVAKNGNMSNGNIRCWCGRGFTAQSISAANSI